MFESWGQGDNIDAISVFDNILKDGVSSDELEKSIQTFTDAGVAAGDLGNIIGYLAESFSTAEAKAEEAAAAEASRIEDIASIMDGIDYDLTVSGMTDYAKAVYDIGIEADQMRKALIGLGLEVDSAETMMVDVWEADQLAQLALAQQTDSLTASETALAEARNDALNSIDDLINDLMGGSLAPVQSLEYFEKQYQDSLTALSYATTPEDISAATQTLMSSAPNYLDFAQDYGGNYNSRFGGVISDLQDFAFQPISDAPPIIGGDTYVNVYIAGEQMENAIVETFNNSTEAQAAARRATA